MPGFADPSDVSIDIEKAELQASRGISPNPRRTSVSSSSSGSSGTSISRQSLARTRTQAAEDFDPSHPENLERQQTAISIYSKTVGADPAHTPSHEPWPEFGGGKDYPPPLTHRDHYVVDFTGPDDPLHGQNWPLRKKLITAAVLGYTTFVSAWGSSIYSAATSEVSAHFGVSTEVSLLGMSFYVLGFAFGPLVWAPLSELKGRRLPLLVSVFGFSIFQIAVAVAKDVQTVLLSRFWGGVFASCPIAVVGAVFADIFKQESRGSAIAVFSMAVFSGPLFGPIVGGFLIENHSLGWRWTEYITAIMGFVALGLNLLFLEETYPPSILVAKAAHLRRLTKNWGIHAKQDEIEINLGELVKKNFSRPLKLLISEPIIFLISLYTAFVYGILYLFLTAYPIVFQQMRGWTPGVGALPYIGMVIGMVLGGALVICFQPWTNRRTAANGGRVRPEDRLPPCIIGAVLFPIGLFWFSWAGNDPNIHWIVPTLAGLPLGLGLITIFLQCLNYLIDAYLMFAASAIAANTFMRSVFAAGFPLFGRYLFAPEPLGVGWAGSLLGFIAVAMIPIPVAFFIWGEKLRGRSKWAPTNM
ncbi:major facilitator superfamily domain-containing protein [Geopyxis carbonaria]|nr:major facilitator superfamily domain-containing protein [Geopyxis carbonaria]